MLCVLFYHVVHLSEVSLFFAICTFSFVPLVSAQLFPFLLPFGLAAFASSDFLYPAKISAYLSTRLPFAYNSLVIYRTLQGLPSSSFVRYKWVRFILCTGRSIGHVEYILGDMYSLPAIR